MEPPELLPEETEYDIEAILNLRKPEDRHIPIKYHVRWADFPLTEDSWEPESHLKNAQKMVQDFHIVFQAQTLHKEGGTVTISPSFTYD